MDSILRFDIDYFDTIEALPVLDGNVMGQDDAAGVGYVFGGDAVDDAVGALCLHFELDACLGGRLLQALGGEEGVGHP
ncbi:hypothetical protein D3C72_1949760 [compost metagenome]